MSSFFKKILKRFQKKPPRTIPSDLLQVYTIGGKIPLIYTYDDSSAKRKLNYTREDVDAYIEKVKNGERTEYGTMDDFLANSVRKFPIKGKKIAIIGSERPRYEAFCIAHGAIPITIEYTHISTDDSRLEIIMPKDLSEETPLFDMAFSLSTYEHSGLGRYGDPLDPNGDINAILELKKIVNKDGLLFLSVPVGKDALIFNLHRIYGRVRLPLLLNTWKLLDSFGFEDGQLDTINGVETIHQPVFVLSNS